MCLSFFHKMKLLAKSFAALAAGIFLFSCKPTDLIRSGELPPIWPDYVNVTIPANIAPLNFGPTDSLKVKGMREKQRNRSQIPSKEMAPCPWDGHRGDYPFYR